MSRRMVNWIKWSLAGQLTGADGAPESGGAGTLVEFGASSRICRATTCSPMRRRSIHAGLYFDGEEAERWLRRGLVLMQREIAEQVLADGGHFERSPMYHAGFVEDMLDT